jgi:hypothetical protein
MNGASTVLHAAASVYPPVGHNHRSHLSSDADHTRHNRVNSDAGGPLASAQNALSQSLGSSGFIDITVSFAESFQRCLCYHPTATEMADLKPGVLKDLMSLLKSRIAADPKQALGAQPRVPAQAALKLLT